MWDKSTREHPVSGQEVACDKLFTCCFLKLMRNSTAILVFPDDPGELAKGQDSLELEPINLLLLFQKSWTEIE